MIFRAKNLPSGYNIDNDGRKYPFLRDDTSNGDQKNNGLPYFPLCASASLRYHPFPGGRMKIAIGSDERTHLTDSVIEKVKSLGHEVTLFGPLAGEAAYWPAVAQETAETVTSGQADEAILFCWTGTGISLAANKVPGIRAALCGDAETAKGARLWNKANVLCMSLRTTSEIIAHEIVEAWFNTGYQPNETDDTCLAQVRAIENKYMKAM